MKFSTFSYILISVAAFGSQAGAQTPASPTPRPTPPPEPILNPVPDFAAWTIVRQTIPGLEKQLPEAVAAAVAGATKPDSLTNVIKTGLVRHQATTTNTREKEDVWYEHGNRITTTSVWKTPMFERAVSSPNQPAGPDFPEFAWISPRNFVGTQEVQNTTYYVFESEMTEGDAKAAKQFGYTVKTTHNRAFVNADTHLPWLLQTEDVLKRYVFQTPPTAPLDVPPEYQKMFDAYEQKKAAAARKPAAP